MLLKIGDDWLNEDQLVKVLRCPSCGQLTMYFVDGEYCCVDEFEFDHAFATNIQAAEGFFQIEFGSEIKIPIIGWTLAKGGFVLAPILVGEIRTIAPVAVLCPDGTVVDWLRDVIFKSREDWEQARKNWKQELEEMKKAEEERHREHELRLQELNEKDKENECKVISIKRGKVPRTKPL
jgi:hypothetical protein